MPLHLDDLKESNEFLNSPIDNINSAVFVVDSGMRIRQVNRALHALFGISEAAAVGQLCGNALGCMFTVSENTPCGTTSNCGRCELRRAAVKSLKQGETTLREKIVREFFMKGALIQRYLEFSTKNVPYQGESMILVIVDDITENETQKLKLLEKQERLDDDLKAAAGIQRSLLPAKIPFTPNFRVAWKFLPCDLIGGDIFDVFSLGGPFFGCYMLDVSGHGVPSAMVSVSVSRALQPGPHDADPVPPGKVCELLNREYPMDRFGKFLTLVYMVVNHEDGTLVYSNAGHPPIILLRANGDLELLSEGGPIIGLDSRIRFTEEQKRLSPGDRLFLYTDGVIECRDDSGEFFGQERLHSLLSSMRTRSLDDSVDSVLECVEAFSRGGTLGDDVSILALEYVGEGGSKLN